MVWCGVVWCGVWHLIRHANVVLQHAIACCSGLNFLLTASIGCATPGSEVDRRTTKTVCGVQPVLIESAVLCIACCVARQTRGWNLQFRWGPFVGRPSHDCKCGAENGAHWPSPLAPEKPPDGDVPRWLGVMYCGAVRCDVGCRFVSDGVVLCRIRRTRSTRR